MKLEEFIYKTHHAVGKTGDSYNRISDFYDGTGLKDTNSLVYKLNPAWANKIGNELTTLTWEQLSEDNYQNYFAMGYFCNTSNWNRRYVTTEDQAKGIWAVAGPSVEMMFASYNARILKSDTLSVSIGTYGTNKYGYLFSPCTGDSPNNDGYGYNSIALSNTECDGMYCNADKEVWLISPSTTDTNAMCAITKYGSELKVRSVSPNGYYYLRVLVSIPSDYRATGDTHVRTAKFVNDIANRIHSIGTYSQITKIDRSTVEPNTNYKIVENLVSTEDSDYSIYMWNNNNILYWYSEFEHPVLPVDCSYLLGSFTALEYADGIRDWDTSNVTNMRSFFDGCFKITTLNLSNWDTSRVANMQNMFNGANLLQKIIVSEKFTVESVTDSAGMFYNCTSLKGGNNTSYDNSKIDKTMAHIDTYESPGYFSAN